MSAQPGACRRFTPCYSALSDGTLKVNVLITDGDNRAALAVTRSLGPHHCVTVAGTRRPTLASSSRYCHDAFVYPDPVLNETAFVDKLLVEARLRRIDLLVPVSDVTTFAIAERRAEFEQFCRLPIPDTRALKTAADKAAIAQLAQEVGVPIPRTKILRDADDGLAAMTEFSFPIVIKPGRSRVRTEHGWLATSVAFAMDAEHLASLLKNLPPQAFPVLMQERIHGQGTGFFACYDRGRCIAVFSHRRLREKPPSGGVSVLCESVPIDDTMRRHAERLLDRLAWHGVAMVEFKHDERDGIPKLMEINGRFWGSLQLAVDAGVDFPSLTTRIGLGDTATHQPDYRVGIRSRWFWGDFDSLLTRLLKRSEREKLAPEERSRLKAIREFCNVFDPNTRFELPRANDLRPWLLETWRWLKPG